MNLARVRAKANAHYTCQECGSTELIQAHHEIPGDDNSLVALCAECHSQRHPDVPRALFFSTDNQPYWHNKSASSLAKELRVHPRTVIRAAKRLKILPGELLPWDEELIKNNIPKLQEPKTASPEAIINAWAKLQHKGFSPVSCLQCGHKWTPTKSQYPRECPQCHCREWDGENAKEHRRLRRIEDGCPYPTDLWKPRQKPHKKQGSQLCFSILEVERLKNEKATQRPAQVA